MLTMRWFALAFALLACTAFAAPPPEYVLALRGTLEVGPDGAVRSYTIEGDTDAAAKKAVEAAVAKWRFRPVVRDGKPVIARTTMHLGLKAIPTEHDTFQLKLETATFGDEVKLRNVPPPKFPYEAAQARLSARVMVVLDVGADGNVRNAGAYQTSLAANTPNEKVAQQWRRLFERSAEIAARSWTVERADGGKAPIAPHQYVVPVEFRMIKRDEDAGRAGWMATVPGPMHFEPWMKLSARRAEAAASAPGGAMVALDTDFDLLSDVIGKTL